MDDDDTELQRLRHAAFSRDGTDDDRRRLALLEARLAKTTLVVDTDEFDVVDALETADPLVADAPEAPADDSAPRPRVPRSGSLRRVVVSAGVGLLVGALVGVLATVAARPDLGGVANWSGVSSLAVFDRDPLPKDDPPGSDAAITGLLAFHGGGQSSDGGKVELRWIGAPGGFPTYAARWVRGDSSRVCVVVTSALESKSSCLAEDDFVADGIRIMAFGLDLRWGPTGEEVWANSSG